VGEKRRQDEHISHAHIADVSADAMVAVADERHRTAQGPRSARTRDGYLHERADDDRRTLLAHECRQLETQGLAGPRPREHKHVFAITPSMEDRLLPRVQRLVPELVERAPQLHVPARVHTAAAVRHPDATDEDTDTDREIKRKIDANPLPQAHPRVNKPDSTFNVPTHALNMPRTQRSEHAPHSTPFTICPNHPHSTVHEGCMHAKPRALTHTHTSWLRAAAQQQ
jgi:hypothetical protein